MASTHRPDDADRTLGEVAQTRAALALRLVAPWWYRLGAALCTASLFTGIGLFPTHESGSDSLAYALVVLGAIVGPAALTTALKRTTGVAMDRYAQGMGLWYLVVFGLLTVGLVVHVWLQVPYALFAGAAVAFVATLLLERHIDRLTARRLAG